MNIPSIPNSSVKPSKKRGYFDERDNIYDLENSMGSLSEASYSDEEINNKSERSFISLKEDDLD